MTTAPFSQQLTLTDVPAFTVLITNFQPKPQHPDEIAYSTQRLPRISLRDCYRIRIETADGSDGSSVIRVSRQGAFPSDVMDLAIGCLADTQSALKLKIRVSHSGRDVIKLVPIESISRIDMSGRLPIDEANCDMAVYGMAMLNGEPNQFKLTCTVSIFEERRLVVGALDWL